MFILEKFVNPENCLSVLVIMSTITFILFPMWLVNYKRIIPRWVIVGRLGFICSLLLLLGVFKTTEPYRQDAIDNYFQGQKSNQEEIMLNIEKENHVVHY